MKLPDSLDDAVSDVTADLPALAVASRNQGLSIRRRRRALAAVGAVAASTVLAIGAYALVPGLDGDDDRGVASNLAAPDISGPPSGATAPITSHGVAAALAASVDEVADGTFGRFQGDVSEGEGLAALLFRPDTGSGPAGQVFVNLQPVSMAGAAPYTCVGYLTEYISDCSTRQLDDDTTLRTYREDGDTEIGAESQRVVAEVIDRARRLRVIVYAMNTNPWVNGEFRDQAVLTTEQLTEIATQPWWSRTRLPVEYVEAGERLDLYEG